jgi:iron complex transport system substrate-binding protein
MPRRFALAAFLTVLAVALASTALATPSRTTAAPFPAPITVSNGKVTVSKRPARIVSLSATATETLFAIGAGRQVIAVDERSDYPRTAPRTTLSGYTPNVEAIAGYRPDLVVISYDPKGLSEALGRLGIPVVHQDAAATLPGAYQQIRQLGKVTGHTAEAARLVTSMKQRIGSIVAKNRPKARARRCTTSSIRRSTPSRRTRSSVASTPCSACGTSPTRRGAAQSTGSRPST